MPMFNVNIYIYIYIYISKIRHLLLTSYISVSSKPSVRKKPKYNSRVINVLFLIYIYIYIYIIYIYIYTERDTERVFNKKEINIICKSFRLCFYQLHIYNKIKYCYGYQIYKLLFYKF